MLLEKALKVLKIIYRESGSILLEFVLKIVEFFMEVKSAVTVFHHLLGLFPIFDFLFEGLLLISSERYLEDKFGSFVGIVMPILLKRVEVSEDKFDVFGGFWKGFNHLFSRRVISGKSNQAADKFAGGKSFSIILGMNAVGY